VGCTSTPNLTQWAENSAGLQTAVAKSEKNLLSKIEESVEVFELSEEEEWTVLSDPEKSQWMSNKSDFSRNIAIIDASMAAMVQYANAVSELAAAGEKGKEASESLIASTTSIFSTLGAVYPAGTAMANGVESLLSEVSDIVTRVQAQDSLAKTMKALEPAVNQMATRVSESGDALQRLVNPVYQLQMKILRGRYGPHKIRYYKQRSAYSSMEAIFAKANSLNDPTNYATNIADTLTSLEQIQGSMRAYHDDVQALKKWRTQARAQISGLKNVAKAWSKTHQNAVVLLEECGGLRSLRSECGNLTAANLKLARNRIESVIDGFSEDAPADTPAVADAQ